jgi:hypothetical protein
VFVFCCSARPLGWGGGFAASGSGRGFRNLFLDRLWLRHMREMPVIPRTKNLFAQALGEGTDWVPSRTSSGFPESLVARGVQTMAVRSWTCGMHK